MPNFPAFEAKYNWDFYTVPQRHMDGRRLHQPRGRALGGSSSLNAMAYVRLGWQYWLQPLGLYRLYCLTYLAFWRVLEFLSNSRFWNRGLNNSQHLLVFEARLSETMNVPKISDSSSRVAGNHLQPQQLGGVNMLGFSAVVSYISIHLHDC